MKQILSSILLVLSISLIVTPAQSQDEIPVAGVTVLLCDADGNVIAKSKTDRDGKYDIVVTRACSDCHLRIDEKDRKSKFAIKEQGVKTVSADDGSASGINSKKGYDYYASVSSMKGYAVKSPRDAASGQASGKRSADFQVRITPDVDADSTPDFCAISIDEPGVHVTGQIYGMAINEKGLPGNSKPTPKSNK
jgi:hypothetical protein